MYFLYCFSATTSISECLSVAEWLKDRKHFMWHFAMLLASLLSRFDKETGSPSCPSASLVQGNNGSSSEKQLLLQKIACKSNSGNLFLVILYGTFDS